MNRKENILRLEDLHVEAGGTEIIKGIDLAIDKGDTHVIFGPNGSGKSTLLGAIMGLPQYEITAGDIVYKGESILDKSIAERANSGLGMSFQTPPSISGLTLGNFLKRFGSDKRIEKLSEDLGLKEHLDRDVNKGFSGGESKASEVLQLIIQKPELVLMDEPDSGVDVENIRVFSQAIAKLLNHGDVERSGLIITHNGNILDQIEPDYGHVLLKGVLSPSEDPYNIFEHLTECGFKDCYDCLLRGERLEC